MRRPPAVSPNLILYFGIVLGLAGLLTALIQGTFSITATALCGAGILLCALFVILRPAAVRQALGGRQVRYGGSAGLMTLAFLAILILLNILASRHSLRWDLTAERAYSVSPQAIQILKSLQEPITITGFFLTNDARRERLRDLLEEYRFYTDKLSFAFVDPDLKPALARKYGMTSYGVLVLERGEKRITTYALDEQELISAIWRLSQEEPKTIYFVTGHGERNPYSFEADGYATIRQTLERSNYIVKTLNLATITDTVPADASALVLANPTGNFTQQERDHFIDYLYHGGKVLWLIDTNAGMVDPYILSDWDVRVRDDLIIEPRNAFFGEFASPIIDRYPEHAITSGLGGRSTLFLYARSLELLQPAPPNITAKPILQTSSDSWGETKITRDMMAQFDANEDTPGPLTLGAAMEERMYGGRLVIITDADFAANSVLDSVKDAFANETLFVQAVHWLTEEQNMIAISARTIEDRPIILTRPQMRLILYSSTLLLPLIILAAGAAVWWSNR